MKKEAPQTGTSYFSHGLREAVFLYCTVAAVSEAVLVDSVEKGFGLILESLDAALVHRCRTVLGALRWAHHRRLIRG